VDVAWRPALGAAARVSRYRPHEICAVRCDRAQHEAALRHPVPSRGDALSAGEGGHLPIRAQCLRMQEGLDHGTLFTPHHITSHVPDFAQQEEFIGKEIARIREICGENGRVIGAVSGGVDSTVAAKLMHEAIGDRYVRGVRAAQRPLTSQ
jgi:hypothetical protein